MTNLIGGVMTPPYELGNKRTTIKNSEVPY